MKKKKQQKRWIEIDISIKLLCVAVYKQNCDKVIHAFIVKYVVAIKKKQIDLNNFNRYQKKIIAETINNVNYNICNLNLVSKKNEIFLKTVILGSVKSIHTFQNFVNYI